MSEVRPTEDSSGGNKLASDSTNHNAMPVSARRRVWKGIYPYLRGVLVATVLLVGIGIGMQWGSPGAQAPHREPVTTEGGRQQLYTCSMHPQVRLADPDARCPYCGMSLIPVRAEEDDDEGLPRLRLSERALALMQIQVQPAERRDIAVPIRLFGQVTYDETRFRAVTAWVPGRIERLHVAFTGSRVEVGDPLFDLYSPELIAAQEELLQARRSAGILRRPEGSSAGEGVTAERTVQAARDRLQFLGVSSVQIEDLLERGRVDDVVTIYASVGGTVIERLADQGDYLSTGEVVFRIVDLDRLWVQMEVFESELQWPALGQRVSFVIPAFPGQAFEGRISFIEPVVTASTRAVRVRAEVPNPDSRLKPGMFVRGTVEARLSESFAATARSDEVPAPSDDSDVHDAHAPGADPLEVDAESAIRLPVLVPASAVLLTGRRAVVYVQVPDMDRPVFEGRDVLLGPKAGAWYVVLDGLEEGELVVTRGAFRLDAELQIKGRPSMMQPTGGGELIHDHGEGHVMRPGSDQDVEALPAPEVFQAALGRLVTANFRLVESLAADSDEQVRQRAIEARAALDAVESDGLDIEAGGRWLSARRTMDDALDALIGEETLVGRRRHFEAFSDQLTEMVRVFGVKGTGPVYRAMCPMVEGREGFWLQDHPQVTNPYHGASMLRCGEITEKLVGTELP